MAQRLSETVEHHLNSIFKATDRQQARILLLQICTSGRESQAADRCEIAALKLSMGSIEKLGQAVNLYHTDFRDLLMAAGFGFDTGAHETWSPVRK